jgi:hypothetical protein
MVRLDVMSYDGKSPREFHVLFSVEESVDRAYRKIGSSGNSQRLNRY